jgi:hypothetical protein
MTVLRLPIDNRLTLSQAQELLRQHCKSSKENCTYALFPGSNGPAEWTMHNDMKWRSYECGEVISVDLQHRWERIAVTEKVIVFNSFNGKKRFNENRLFTRAVTLFSLRSQSS